MTGDPSVIVTTEAYGLVVVVVESVVVVEPPEAGAMASLAGAVAIASAAPEAGA